MPKKHRVKRQKYVEHLLACEKVREEYLEKRQRGKRSREAAMAEEDEADRVIVESKSKRLRREEDMTAPEEEEVPVQAAPSREDEEPTIRRKKLNRRY